MKKEMDKGEFVIMVIICVITMIIGIIDTQLGGTLPTKISCIGLVFVILGIISGWNMGFIKGMHLAILLGILAGLLVHLSVPLKVLVGFGTFACILIGNVIDFFWRKWRVH